MQANSETGSFINGRAQIVEMLKIMPADERETLLKNMKMRNPSLVNELVEESLTFEQVVNLNEHEIRLLLQYVEPPILGVALKASAPTLQRKILAAAPRNYAEHAYKVLMAPMANEKRDTERAQNKIVSIVVSLKKRNQLTI